MESSLHPKLDHLLTAFYIINGISTTRTDTTNEEYRFIIKMVFLFSILAFALMDHVNQ